MTDLSTREWRSGTGKVLAVDDVVYLDSKKAQPYVLHEFREEAGRVVASVFGGLKTRPRWRTFPVDRLTRYRTPPPVKGRQQKEDS